MDNTVFQIDALYLKQLAPPVLFFFFFKYKALRPHSSDKGTTFMSHKLIHVHSLLLGHGCNPHTIQVSSTQVKLDSKLLS